MGMGNLQRMAQQMQQEMQRIEGELRSAQVDGSAGGGVVTAVVTGKQELVSVTIDPAADNDRAIAAYAKIGFRPVGRMRQYQRLRDGRWVDALLMDLLAPELVR